MAGKGSINKVLLMGHLGDNPELRYTPAGDAVASFRLATNRTWKDKQGKQQEKTEWHRVVVWRKLAEICGEYLKKGSHIYVEGRLETRSWDDAGGNKKYITEVVASTMQMLDSSKSTPAEERQSSPSVSVSDDIKDVDDEEIPF